MILDQLLEATNASLKSRGIRLVVEQRKDSLCLRGTWTDLLGERKRRRLPLGIAATPAGVTQADAAAVEAWAAIGSGEDPAGTLAADEGLLGSGGPERLTVADAVARFQASFWETRSRTPSAEMTWRRMGTELNRLPDKALLTVDLLEAVVIGETEPDSRSRVEACKTFKRMGRLVGMEELDRLDRLKGNYEPAQRELLSDQQLVAFLDEVRDTKWGWTLCAAATFGQRPGEVPSLVIGEDGKTASSITVKRHKRKPAMRTCFALPSAWVERWNLRDVDIPGEFRWTRPEDYDSRSGERFVSTWLSGLRAKKIRAAINDHLGEGYNNQLLRHCWAVRSIKSGLRVSLCAKAMGHTIAIHERQYHRWLQEADLKDALSRLDV